ncbi:MAG: YqeG family HAD IIIA-type phosphatase [Oscillospiraceae bacterium]|nr:YqeG family HAD IIIA-type phosphatase [Oscillospiraceae bacterium]
MSFSLLPTMRTRELTDLTPEFLYKKDIRLLMMDFDNTIVPYTTNTPTRKMLQWLEMISEYDIQLCVVSNSKKDRVEKFCEEYGIDCITHAGKPGTKGIKACLYQYGVQEDYAALVGDQIYTDVLGANRAGVRSILVKSIRNHTIWLAARHVLELPFIFFARKRRIHL